MNFILVSFAIIGIAAARTTLNSSIKQFSESCDPVQCRPPNCSCFGTQPPGSLTKEDVPQFVMLTFDDAITMRNIETYRKIGNVTKNQNGCPITMTFFVTHEYNDYEYVNEMYKRGHEIAVHSITHETDTDTWRNATYDRWHAEMAGMRRILEKYGQIPASEIKGHRAPFLQTGGDVTFQMLKNDGFAYDSSMPTRVFMDPPIWPYTLDHGFVQDCQIQPCPTQDFPGLWLFPMVQWRKTSIDRAYGRIDFHCSMVDACTPYPTNAKETYDYFMENFNRHYQSNKAPFPIFLHEAWLQVPDRLTGYINFLEDILKKPDVFVVSMKEVLEYMKKPQTLNGYKASSKECLANKRPEAGDCRTPMMCGFKDRNIYMKSCIRCPPKFPWLNNAQF